MKAIYERWEKGVKVEEQIIDDATPEEIDLRTALNTAITAMQTIQATNIDTVAKANAAIHTLAQINEKLLKWIRQKVT